MSLPSYSNEEVKYFHPVMKDALESAINELGLDDEYEVDHHPRFGTIPPDFALKSKRSGKYHLVVEVKRHPSDVVSTRYRHQAKSYVEEAGGMAEKKYYAISNLEYTDLFLHSNEATRSSVLLQLLKGGPYVSGNLEEARLTPENEVAFRSNLIENFKKIIVLIQRDYADYTSMSTKLYELLSNSCNNEEQWHKALMVCGYEWMRGAMSSARRLPPRVREAMTYRQNPQRMAEAGKSIDFETLYAEPYPSSTDTELWDVSLLEEMNRHGKKWMSGDELAAFAHEVVYGDRHHDGIVMTDLELSRLLAAIARRVHGCNLEENEKICDPAAGAGTLVSNVQYSFDAIQPKQIWANEKEQFLKAPLAIRVGLAYASSISPTNAPIITAKNILELNRRDFENVKVIIINPPYVRRVDSDGLCAQFAQRILEISGQPSMTNKGQAGLETLFIELVFELAQTGTTICCILPQQYLQLRGSGAKAFRKFLLEKFNLKLVATYPMKGLFETVTKATSIFATKKDDLGDTIELLELAHPLADLDVCGTISSAATESYGLNVKILEKSTLEAQVSNGWAEHIGSRGLSLLVMEELKRESNVEFLKLKEYADFSIRRGRLGNSGGTKLIYPNINTTIWRSLEPLIPIDWFNAGINYADSSNKVVLLANELTLFTLTPPVDSYVAGTVNNGILQTIVNQYISIVNDAEHNGQRQEEKTQDQLIALIKSESRKISDSPVLIPRNLRRQGRVFYSRDNVYVSTNFIEVFGNVEEKKLLASWLMTSFSQLNFELLSTPREGTRKLEVGDIKEVAIPKFSELSADNKNTIIDVFDALNGEEQFIDLYCPHIQGSPMDDVWYECLWGNRFGMIKSEVVGNLSDVTYERDPNGNCN